MTWGLGDWGSWRLRTWGLGDLGSWRLRTWGLGDLGTGDCGLGDWGTGDCGLGETFNIAISLLPYFLLHAATVIQAFEETSCILDLNYAPLLLPTSLLPTPYSLSPYLPTPYSLLPISLSPYLPISLSPYLLMFFCLICIVSS